MRWRSTRSRKSSKASGRAASAASTSPEWFDRLSLDEGYAVQLGLLARRVTAGARLIGWKVGLLARHAGAVPHPEPLFGYLLDDAPTPRDALRRRGASASRASRTSYACAWAAIWSGQGWTSRPPAPPSPPSTRRWRSPRRAATSGQLAVAIADNIQQRYVVLGPETRPLPADLDLADVQARVVMNSAAVATASGADVLGQPLRSLVWLANKLVQHGHHLRARSSS